MKRRQLSDILREEKRIWIKYNYEDWLEFFKNNYAKFIEREEGKQKYWVQLMILD